MVLQGKGISIIMYLTAEATEMVIFLLDFSQTFNLTTDLGRFEKKRSYWLHQNDPIGVEIQYNH